MKKKTIKAILDRQLLKYIFSPKRKLNARINDKYNDLNAVETTEFVNFIRKHVHQSQ